VSARALPLASCAVGWLLVGGCAEPLAARTQPRSEPDTSWIGSDKLDADLQELVLRAWEADLRFPFRVRTRADDGGVAETVERVRPSEIETFVRDDRVVAVRCAPPTLEPVSDESWRAKVDPDVRTVLGARSACWTAVALRFEREPSDAEWALAEQTGIVVHARDARTALVWAPVRAIPGIAKMTFIASIEPSRRGGE
jgi:hypothetical protein